jgi:hypothetical protein
MTQSGHFLRLKLTGSRGLGGDAGAAQALLAILPFHDDGLMPSITHRVSIGSRPQWV